MIFTCFEIILSLMVFQGRYSSVGIVTSYGLDSPGIESQWGRDFPHLCRPALGPTTSPGVKQPGRGVDHPPPSSAKVTERVELYIFSPYMACSRVNCTFILMVFHDILV